MSTVWTSTLGVKGLCTWKMPRTEATLPVSRQEGASGAGQQTLPTRLSSRLNTEVHFSCNSLSLQVVEAYKQGLRPAVGFELNPWLLCLSSYRTWKAGYHGKVCFLKKDFWKVTVSPGSGCAQRWP